MTEVEKTENLILTPEALGALGEGEIAYVRPIRSEDVNRLFPGVPPVPPGQQLFALLGASGQPIVIADSRDALIQNAWDNDLTTVSVH
jgi:hypothetical protein